MRRVMRVRQCHADSAAPYTTRLNELLLEFARLFAGVLNVLHGSITGPRGDHEPVAIASKGAYWVALVCNLAKRKIAMVAVQCETPSTRVACVIEYFFH